uniref:Major facilitator superfamily (MFS) profile domain-containing protein n=1 Tax=Quercus lobata TaxID=97700 RepID=A0A7N2KWR0_QUELO
MVMTRRVHLGHGRGEKRRRYSASLALFFEFSLLRSHSAVDRCISVTKQSHSTLAKVLRVMSMILQVTAASSYFANSGAMYLSVGGMLMFVFTFALGAGPVPGLLLPEIFPSRIRAKAMAICMSVHWVINFFVGLLFLRLLEQLGPQLLYSIFSSFCLIAVVFVKRNVVETKGKSLQEIEIALLPQE